MGQIDYYVPAGYPSLQKISRDAAFSRWWFQTVFYHYIYLGKMIQFDEHIFFQRGGSTTNYQLMVNWWLGLVV